LKVTLIVTVGTAAVAAAKQATSVIPIVFATAGDPVGTGLIASLARPGGNVTGISNQSADLPGKRLELLREVNPKLRHLAVMANAGSRIGVLERREAQAAARTLGLEWAALEIRRGEDLAPAIEAQKGLADALYVVTEPLLNTHRALINSLALGARLPTIHGGTDLASPTSFGVRATTPTRFCVARSLPIFPSNNRRDSNWPSTSKPPRRSA
jgi:putative ABC transport system substrate-binding protein